MAADLKEMIARLEAEGADPRLAMPPRALITNSYSGFTLRSVLTLSGLAVVAAMIVTACVLYVLERDELSVGRTVMNAGVDVTHMPPTELGRGSPSTRRRPQSSRRWSTLLPVFHLI